LATIHTARNTIVSLLYARDLGSDDLMSLKEDLLEEQKIRNRQKVFVDEVFDGILNNIETLDSIIESNLKDIKINEIGIIEKAVLRLSIYEILFTKVDKAIAINEAIELIRDFGIDEASRFINGLLDHLK
jgi:N utilization substance protein B